ncbi:MAG: hypothetical protein ACOC83_04990 [Gemmatimonadota bacterium]
MGSSERSSERQKRVLSSLELPDGSMCGGMLVGDGEGTVLRLFSEVDLHPGDEVELPGDRYLSVTGTRHRVLDDFLVTELAVQGPFQRRLQGHELGDGWPQGYWRELAARCDEEGFARPVVRFLDFLGELRSSKQMGLARGRMRSLSAEHLAAVTGQVGGGLMNLERLGAPNALVGKVSALYRALLDEMGARCEDGEYLQPPAASSRLGFGGRRPDGWRECRDWDDVVP